MHVILGIRCTCSLIKYNYPTFQSHLLKQYDNKPCHLQYIWKAELENEGK